MNSEEIQAFELEYNKNSRRYDALAREVEFAIREVAQEKQIKLHDVEWRVKSVSSCLAKIESKFEKNRYQIPTDIVGIRVICLLRSDMERVEAILKSIFNVESVDDKFKGDPAVFGYMSVHYICTLSDKNRGPRYDSLKRMKFEVQVRTICVHAWAAVSHYLEYKGEWDVPTNLMKSMNALSAIFYVADTQFEELYKAREDSSALAISEARTDEILDNELNLDTLGAYLKKKFPEKSFSKAGLSELTQELHGSGYMAISNLEKDLDRAMDAYLRYEKDHPPSSGGPFNAIGAVRVALCIVSDAFRDMRGEREGGDLYGQYKKYLR